MYLLDTRVLFELRRRHRTDPKVAAWADRVDPTDLYLSAITILEIEAAALLLERKDIAQGKLLRTWLEEKILSAFAGRILPVDIVVARRCAALHVPDPKPERDALIAGTALVHRLPIVTRNLADFRSMGVELINPWA